MWEWSGLKSKNTHPTAVDEDGNPLHYVGAPATCGRLAIRDSVEIRERFDGESWTAYATGVRTCGSVWACPVCSASIRHRRAQELSELIGVHLEEGGGLEFVTLTLRHHMGDDLGSTLDAVALGWQRTIAGKAWQDRKRRLGIMGNVRAIEITYGNNGWHPHIHVLMFTERAWSANEREAFSGWLHERWRRRVVALGGKAPTQRHGVDIQPVRSPEEAGVYLAKVQDDNGKERERNITLEMMRGDLKSARRRSITPFELLDHIGGDDEAAHRKALRLWHEYEQATRGRRCMTGQSQLRRLYGLDEEATDEEAAADEPDEELEETRTVLMVPAPSWKLLCDHGLDIEILDAVESGGAAAGFRVVKLAQSLGWRDWSRVASP